MNDNQISEKLINKTLYAAKKVLKLKKIIQTVSISCASVAIVLTAVLLFARSTPIRDITLEEIPQNTFAPVESSIESATGTPIIESLYLQNSIIIPLTNNMAAAKEVDIDINSTFSTKLNGGTIIDEIAQYGMDADKELHSDAVSSLEQLDNILETYDYFIVLAQAPNIPNRYDEISIKVIENNIAILKFTSFDYHKYLELLSFYQL